MIARFSSGTKMLVIMTVALLPLGIVALFASIQSAHDKRLQHEGDARLIATAEARQLDLVIIRSANVVRAAAFASGGDGTQCSRIVARVAHALPNDARFAFFGPDGQLRCASTGFGSGDLPPVRGNIGIELLLLDKPGGIRFTVGASDGSYGVGELPQAQLAGSISGSGGNQSVLLRQGAARLPLVGAHPAGPLDQPITVSAPIAGGQINLVATIFASTISVIEVLLVLLPLLMWAAAAIIGWSVVQGLLLRPLGQLQRSVAQLGSEPLSLPRLQTPATEISALADSFRHAAEQIATRELALEEGLSRQVRLTREVHHRVKNNLQVVASLIALHARGSNGDVAAAYASIQRRVDALAVVHRNHYAELEENRGVALRSLIGELTSNLRATAPPEASHFHITLDMAAVHVSQDVAVPVAFLLTEMLELLMIAAPADPVMISVRTTDRPDRALMTIRAAGLASAAATGSAARQRFDRIAGGLARQLRSPLTLDEDGGRYAIEIMIVPDEAQEID
ncbi:sensor histidine kinase [Sphingomonas sp. BIUV-7]|uniref:histidine kinase n=1 Tax=Sphingomonas natans TaxID=3063330 RepID=A0ABT8Y692_9SPHN|nr:sensor histidine kinase [Sphingomonas sp. BIUV-7]MDO6413842.1 sensor histidine kinase [Sphingomonas sp. BIUV-7]